MLRSNDVHCTPMILSTPEETPTHRLGTYYLETGYGIRPSKVTYDRKHSAITEYDLTKVDIEQLLDGFDWLHLSGITPALCKSCADFILECLKVAKEKGLTVSFDGNFRSKLWTWEEARDYCTKCLPYIDVLLGIEPYHLWKDENDHSKGDWKDGVPLQPSYEEQDKIFQKFVEKYPNLKCIARHIRYAHSGSQNSLKAFLWYEGHTFESKMFTFNILDRVGGGDALASSLIYAMMNDYKPMDIANFAVASSVLKHTIRGDANITDNAVDYVEVGDYIFVHGWIPCNPYNGKIDENWRDDDWSSARWLNGMSAWHRGAKIPGKTIVCGHWNSSWGHSHLHQDRKEFPQKNRVNWEKSFEPFIDEGIIAIDACTAYTGFCNCLVLEV